MVLQRIAKVENGDQSWKDSFLIASLHDSA